MNKATLMCVLCPFELPFCWDFKALTLHCMIQQTPMGAPPNCAIKGNLLLLLPIHPNLSEEIIPTFLTGILLCPATVVGIWITAHNPSFAVKLILSGLLNSGCEFRFEKCICKSCYKARLSKRQYIRCCHPGGCRP